MSPVTIFLARLVGAYCALIALTMLIRKRETIATVNAMVEDSGAIMIAGVFALAAGLAMILGHNVWSGGPLTVAVTVVGWVVALKGFSLLVLPRAALTAGYRALRYEGMFTAYMVATLALGLGFLWASFRG